MKILNPEYKPHKGLPGIDDDAAWDTLKAKVQSYLQTNAAKSVVLIADVRNLDAKLLDERVWAQIMGDLGLVVVP